MPSPRPVNSKNFPCKSKAGSSRHLDRTCLQAPLSSDLRMWFLVREVSLAIHQPRGDIFGSIKRCHNPRQPRRLELP